MEPSTVEFFDWNIAVLGKRQFSIGKLIYVTLFAATLLASYMAGFPYGFIYTGAFIVVCSIYVVWQITRPLPGLPEQTILDEWDAENDSMDSKTSQR